MVFPSLRVLPRPLAQFGYGAKDFHQAFRSVPAPRPAARSRQNRLPHRFGQVIALLVRGEGAVLDVFAIVLDGGADQRAGVGIAAHKLGRRREGQVQQVVEDEDLAVAIGPGADADGGNGQLGGNGRGHFARNAFQHDGAGSGIGQGVRVGLELQDGFGGAGLHAVAAHAVNALRSQAEVADDGNLRLGEGAHQFDARAFDLDGLGAGFLDEADGVGQAFGTVP
jgi:hypothetical protein